MRFLDWKRAFDNTDQVMIHSALYRLSIPEKLLHVIGSFYEAPRFRVKDLEG